jgi:hypothetical protein
MRRIETAARAAQSSPAVRNRDARKRRHAPRILDCRRIRRARRRVAQKPVRQAQTKRLRPGTSWHYSTPDRTLFLVCESRGTIVFGTNRLARRRTQRDQPDIVLQCSLPTPINVQLVYHRVLVSYYLGDASEQASLAWNDQYRRVGLWEVVFGCAVGELGGALIGA